MPKVVYWSGEWVEASSYEELVAGLFPPSCEIRESDLRRGIWGPSPSYLQVCREYLPKWFDVDMCFGWVLKRTRAMRGACSRNCILWMSTPLHETLIYPRSMPTYTGYFAPLLWSKHPYYWKNPVLGEDDPSRFSQTAGSQGYHRITRLWPLC